jgi:hypothetical protein
VIVPVHPVRDRMCFIHQVARTCEVVVAFRKQRLLINVEAVPYWSNGDLVLHPREFRIVNVPSFRRRNLLSRPANVRYPEHPNDRDIHRSKASTVLANVSRFAESKVTKRVVSALELFLEFAAPS